MNKIFQINECLNSSTGKIARQIGETAINNGWESYIAYSAYEDYIPTPSKTIAIGSRFEHIEHAIETRLFDNHGLASRRATYKLVKQIQEINPDVIHLHNIHGYYLNYQILFNYLIKKDTPVIWTLHDCWAFTGHCPHFVTAECNRWKLGCYSCPLRNEYPKSLFVDNSQKNYLLKKNLFTSVKRMMLVPVSYWLGNLLKDSFLKDYPITLINNGIDLSVFSRQNISLLNGIKNDNLIIIIGVANIWNKSKGIDEFVMLSKIPNYKVIMVGVTPKLKEQLPANIVAIERTNNQNELAQLYSLADVLVNPTYADSFPTINIEAIACGTPVVTYRTGGSSEIIDENTGIVVEQGNFSSLLEAINTIGKKGPKEKIIMRKSCRDRAELLYDRNKRFEDYIKLYNSLI